MNVSLDCVRTELLASVPAGAKWTVWVDGVLERLIECEVES